MIKKAPKNFPKTKAAGFIGQVFNNSKVPDLYSSAKLRIVMVGIKKSNTQGTKSINGVKVA
jgi:hypothetical protein